MGNSFANIYLQSRGKKQFQKCQLNLIARGGVDD